MVQGVLLSFARELGKDFLLQPRVCLCLAGGSGLWDPGAVPRRYTQKWNDLIFTASPPANLVEHNYRHLQDPKVVVLKLNLRAVSWRSTWFGGDGSPDVPQSHLRVYHDDKYQIDEICGDNPQNRSSDERSSVRAPGHLFSRLEKRCDATITEGTDPVLRGKWRIAGPCLGTYLARTPEEHYTTTGIRNASGCSGGLPIASSSVSAGSG